MLIPRLILYTILFNQLLEHFESNQELLDDEKKRYISTPTKDQSDSLLEKSPKKAYKELLNHNLVEEKENRTYLLRIENWDS